MIIDELDTKIGRHALAAPAEEEGLLRGLRMYELDPRLGELQSQLLRLQARINPRRSGSGGFFRIMDVLLRVSDQRCRLWGLYTHPYRWDRWYRRDVPAAALVAGQRKIAQLKRQSRILESRCQPSLRKTVVPVGELTTVPLTEVDAVVPVSVRRLFDQLAA